MKKSIQRQKLALVKEILEKIENYFTGDVDVNLADAILRNVEVIEAELELINKNPALKEPEEFKVYDEKRIGLVKEFAEKDENGEIVIIPGTQDAQLTPEGQEKFQQAIVDLKAEYADLMAEVEAINKRREEFMEGEVELDITPIEKSLLGKIKSEGKPSGFALAVMATIRPFLAD